MQDNQQKQLITELTPEEGAVIEGGATLFLYGAYAKQAGADKFPFSWRGNWGDGDDLYITVNGKKVFGPQDDVDTGEFVRINRRISFGRYAKISLFDADRKSRDDFLGGFTVGSTPTKGIKSTTVMGSGSIYSVFYRVTA